MVEMRAAFVLLAFGISLLTAYGQDAKKGNNKNLAMAAGAQSADTADVPIQSTINLSNSFKLELGHEKDYTTFKLYGFIRLLQNGQKVYADSSYEYEPQSSLYPLVIPAGDSNFEVLVEVNDRPNKNYLQRLFVANGKVTKVDKLPSFIAPAADLNGDGTLEYAGYWAYNETWGEDKEFTDYNPIIYYSITPKGLKVNSDYTRKQNDSIFGFFHGYEYSQNIDIPASALKKQAEEIERIKAAANASR
jgi:hypothetical protein